MRKFSNSKKAAILASILGGWMFGGSALAANLLVTVPSNYGTSNMSVITGSRVTTRIDGPKTAVINSLNKDPGTYSFVLDGKSMFLLRQYTYSTSDLIPARVIGADTTWSSDETYPSGTITKGANPHSAAGYNGYIYTGDYDLGTIGVVKYSDSVLTEEVSKSRNLMDDLNTYVGTSYASPAWVHGEGMVIKDGQLYVVVSVNPEGGYNPYDDSFIMQYQIEADGSLTYVGYTTSARNPDSVKLNNYNNLLMHTGIGGYQYTGHGNPDSKISIGNIEGGVLQKTSQDVVIPDNVKGDGLDFRDMTVWPNGTAYILAYNLSTSGGGSNLKIYKTTVANLCSSNPADWETVIEGETEGGGDTGVGTGWFNKMFAEYQTKRIWAELGDNIVVYTDGDTKPTYTWSAYTLAGNTTYHTFNSVSLLSGDTVVGEKALLTSSREEGLTAPSVTTSKVVNVNANSKKGDYFKHITGTSDDSATYSGVSSDNSTYTFDADKTINLNAASWKTQADLTNNILAAIYAHDGNDITVNAGSNTLQLQTQSLIATPVGVYAGNGKNVTINAGTLNIITASATGGNSLNNAIMNDAGKESASKITVNGDVNISMVGAYGGNGVAVQKTDRWGEASYASNVENSIAINGNLTIKGADSETWGIPLNQDNVLSRFNNAGILTQVENSRVDVSGTADMDVYGNGITTNAAGSTVSIGGGEINVPKGMSYGYYTLGAYQGTINVNTGKNGDVVGSNTVKLGGDIFALSTGTVNVALTNEDSYLRGIVDNGGTVNMWLQNGATWINQANNSRYSQDNEDVGSNGASHITRLTGGSSGNEGVIFQKSDSKDITVDSYSGSTMVIYEHDSSNPTSILGGNFTVKAADSDSAITMRTDSDGIDTTSEETVSKVLDALANKLYYTAYINGEANLEGTVQIAEGLTAASVTRSAGTVEYDSSTGQGKLGEIVPDKTETPDGDNAYNNKQFLVDNGVWKGNNSGNQVNLTLKKQAVWEGNNTGSQMTVKATDSTWKGDNKGTDIRVTLDDSTWEGNNEGTDAAVTLQNSSTWRGDSSGSGLQLTLKDSDYEGNISGSNSSVTLNDNSSWSGSNSGNNFTLNLQGDSIWQLKGDSVITNFNASAGTVALLSLTAAAGGGPTIDMTDSTAGNLNIQNYNGNATVVMAHAADDVTKVNGGNITIGTATSGSGITLLTDSSGMDLTNKYVINDALNALANKLYYTGYKNGEKNLSGYAKIAEGLTSASISKFVGDIQYDSATGQGSLDKSSVDYGKDWPSAQSKTTFTTKLSGDYTTDKEYRDAGVLPDTNNIYKFTKEATTVTTAGSSVTTAKDTTLELNKHNMTITSTGGDAIATTGGTLTVKDAGSLTLKGANAIAAANSKVVVNAAGADLNGNVKAEGADSAVTVTTTGATSIGGSLTANGEKASATINAQSSNITGDVSASGNNSSVSVTTSGNTTITGAVSANGANANVSINGTGISIGNGVNVSGSGAKVAAKSINKLDGDVTTDADASAELTFAEGAAWTGSNAGSTTMSMNKGTWNGANSGRLNATLANGTVWTGDSSGAGSTISLNASTWNGANSGANSSVTLTSGSSWSKANTADGVTVSADKSTWSGANSGDKANITLTNGAGWNGANSGSNATVTLTDSSWTGDNSGAGLSLSAANSSWSGSTSAGGSATLTSGSSWTGASTGEGFSLSLNGSTWNNTGASKLTSFASTGGVVSMDSAASVTVGSYSGDATVIYKHNNSNPTEVYGGNFTVGKAEAGSRITLLTDNTGVDTTDEDRINEALDALANKLYYTAYTTGESNLAGTVKIAEGLTAVSAAKQTADIVYDKSTGQGSADHKSVTPGPVYPDTQDRTAFVTSITGEHETDKEYRKAGVLSQSEDNNIYKFTKEATTVTTAGSSVTTAKDTTLELNKHNMTITSTGGDAIATTGGTLTVKDAGSLTLKGANAIAAANSKVVVNAAGADLNGNVKAEGADSAVTVTTTGATSIGGSLTANGEKASATINAQSSNITGDVSASGNNSSVSVTTSGNTTITGAVSANGANANVSINGTGISIGNGVNVSGSGAKVAAKSINKLDGDVTTDADASAELTFAEGAAWTGSNAGSTTMSMNKGTWNGANSGRLNATLANGTVWTGDSSGAGSTISLNASTWNGANSGANSSVTLTSGSSWSKANTADGVTVSADKSTWSGANSGDKANITLTNGAGWNGANSGSNATVTLTDSSWTGDNSGAGLSLSAANSSWSGSTSAGGSATLTSGSSWTGASTGEGFSLSLNGSTWNNTGASKLTSFASTGGVVSMDSAASVTVGSYSGDATVIYKHNNSNPTEVYGGNFTVGKAEAGSRITLLTDRSGVDLTDEDSIAGALNALANKLYYTGYTAGERSLAGYVKLAEGLTASSVIKQTGDITYDSSTGQGSLKDGSVTPNVEYPDKQTAESFTTQITGVWKQDKEYKLAGVLHVDNATYDFTKGTTTISTDDTSIGAGKDLLLQMNDNSMKLKSAVDAVVADKITIEFNDLNKLDIDAAGKALLAQNGGRIILHNNGVVSTNSAVVANGTGSSIKTDGLTNITVGSGDAVSADAGSIDLAGGTITGDVHVADKGTVNINSANAAAGDKLAVITGDINAAGGSTINIGLGTADSKLTGDVSTSDTSEINIYAANGTWTGNAAGDGVSLNLGSKASWNNSGNSKLKSLQGSGLINQTADDAGNINVGSYNGDITVNYKHTADKDAATGALSNIKFSGGDLSIDKAEKGSKITLRTDNSDELGYSETEKIEQLFRELSKKLYYADAGINPDNLSGRVEIAEGLTKVKVYGDIGYDAQGQGAYTDGSIKRTDPEIVYGSSETAMMRGAKSAMASTALLWRSEASDMLQRMGDVRLAREESGLWAHYYGGKSSFDAKNTKYSTSYNAYQLGYDKQLDNGLLFGAAVSYDKGKNTYEMGGHGDGKSVSLAVYGSWNGAKGHYADVIVKGGQLDNDYTVYNDMGHKLEGDYDTWGMSLSAEYGRRMQLQNGFYLDPSVQFTVGRIAGTDYNAASDFLDSKGLNKYMHVSQDAFTTAIGRIGLGIGKTTEKSMFYTKLAWAHEFSGDFTTTFSAENEPTSGTQVDFGGSWFEWQLGGSVKMNDNSYVYATFEKKFGGDTGSNDWRLDAGLRWSF